MKYGLNITQKISIAIAAIFSLAFRCGEDPPTPSGVDSGIVFDEDAGMEDGSMPILGIVYPEFLAPHDHQEVPQDFVFRFAASGVTIAPKSDVALGKGYFVLAMDASCTPANSVAPMDDRHIHLVGGESEIAVRMTPGMHTFCLQVAYGDGRVYEGEAKLVAYLF